MSTLKTHEKAIFEKLLDRGGYVLDLQTQPLLLFFVNTV